MEAFKRAGKVVTATSTNRMCTSKFASISLLLPIVNGMIFGVKNVQLTMEVAKNARNLFLKSLNKRFTEIEINLTITSAAILDPRVKSLPIREF